ncbi:hypothetical protein K432DRAFT_444833 [Lepidopterella palustris CBS 459.81]|uniref:CorA-like transporter domain-containing protein n=1 Tax=Lepidopterella palustris CBS 459.81 TaxID=1314670 RepID=A0A8E2JDK6_9PEZI|nr:hypothetical protein K432DRAFT_444833 [Lepidopterella palustris CBS 459.81]
MSCTNSVQKYGTNSLDVKPPMPIVKSITLRLLKPKRRVKLIMIMFVEKNGRNRGDPWSLRQTGVYQQVTFDSRQSAWIFLQLSSSTRAALEKVLRSQPSSPGENDSPMTLHALLLGTTVDNWDEYIQNLSTQLRDVTLQRLRHKILKTSSVLTSCLDVATKLQEHCHRLDKLGFTPKSDKIEKSIEAYAADIQVHQQSVRVIMETLQSTFDLLSKIIEFRNIESLRSIIEASEKHIVFLKDLTLRIHHENCTSATLAVHTHKDTKAMKALTTIATTLLPASLMATIFSSNLVQVKQDGASDGQGTHLVVATQFWIYVVVTLALTVITLGCTRLLEYQWLRGLL